MAEEAKAAREAMCKENPDMLRPTPEQAEAFKRAFAKPPRNGQKFYWT